MKLQHSQMCQHFCTQNLSLYLNISGKHREAAAQSGEKAGMKKVKKNKYWVWIPGPYWGRR